jgi:hypothetical protein
MTSEPDWHQALARVTGQLVRGEQRVSSHELLTVHLGVPVTDRACRRLRRVMRDLGWHGPRLMRWGKKTLKGYWRDPTVSLPAIVREGPVVEVARVERVTRLGLQKLEQILRIPTDRGDGNLQRAQTAAAGLAVNAQLRADQARMKQVPRRDVMERLLAMLAEEKAKMAEEKRLERGEREGPAGARTEIVGRRGSLKCTKQAGGCCARSPLVRDTNGTLRLICFYNLLAVLQFLHTPTDST